VSKKEARLFVFAAPSGAGKTTIARDVLKNYNEFVFSISATTRKKRATEVDGEDYFFLSEKEFKEKIERNEFVEWEKFYDYYYGTLKCQIDSNIEKGLHTVFDVDVKGAVKIKEHYGNLAVLIFIAPPSIEELRNRLIQRNTETEEDLKKRIERAEMELSYKGKFDYVVSNIDLNTAKEEVRKIIENEIKENK
jgi:guanylate kinase